MLMDAFPSGRACSRGGRPDGAAMPDYVGPPRPARARRHPSSPGGGITLGQEGVTGDAPTKEDDRMWVWGSFIAVLI